MRIVFIFCLIFLFKMSGIAQTIKNGIFQLAPPILHYKQTLFSDQTKVRLQFDMKDVAIYYTTDGSKPDQQATLYQETILIDRSTLLQAIVFHKDYRTSEISSVQLIKVNHPFPIKKITLTNLPNKKYPGKGTAGLFDLKKGSLDFNEDQWMGFNDPAIEMLLELKKKTTFSEIKLCMLSDMNSWIFAPSSVEIFISDDAKTFQSISFKNAAIPTAEAPSKLLYLSQQFKTQKAKYIKIIINNIPAIPAWHPGAGFPAWLFIDEIIID